ncbi:MarR family transcriptional regulator [Rugosimonospora africana]|uniref:HTH marR-type domain-containing protein n=1 Tax=Rugosimonospora africana TaxID=556532 RepID=A0A8J3VS47_9ACTN|nr:MarR family transcriptional regulator [Rugosimonospora africana]GIH16719.1 hypothetical protein Raf01_48910 [Rugosimonospora africana]
MLIKLAQALMTLREVAQAVEVDPSAATVAVDLFERRGLVRRLPHPHDILTDPPPALAALDADDIAALTRIFVTLNTKPEPRTTPTADSN